MVSRNVQSSYCYLQCRQRQNGLEASSQDDDLMIQSHAGWCELKSDSITRAKGKLPSELESRSNRITLGEKQSEMPLLLRKMHRKGYWRELQYSYRLQATSQRPTLSELPVLRVKAPPPPSPQWRTKTLHHQASFHHEEAPQVSAWDFSVQRKRFWSPYQKLTGLLQSQVKGFQIFHLAHHRLHLPWIPSRRLGRPKRPKYGRRIKRRYCWGHLSTCSSIPERIFGRSLSRHSMSGSECQRRVLPSSQRW